jgi:tetratricopeptide (TPR) repeat protein
LALRRAPGNPELLLNLALARYKQAKFSEAAVDLQKVRRAQPENRQALYLLADCYLRMGRNKDVISLLQPVYDAGPEDRAVEYALGMALLHDGQIQQGEVIIDRVLKSGTSAEAQLLLGAAQLTAGDAKTALPTLQKAMDMNPDLPGGWSLYGKALLDTGDGEAAKPILEKALQADPNDFDANLYLGGLLRHDGDLARAAPFLQKALVLRPASIEARYQMGMLDLGQGKLEEARGIFEHIERESPNFQEVHAQLAVVYARLKRPEDSKRERDIVLQLNEKARGEKKQ